MQRQKLSAEEAEHADKVDVGDDCLYLLDIYMDIYDMLYMDIEDDWDKCYISYISIIYMFYYHLY